MNERGLLPLPAAPPSVDAWECPSRVREGEEAPKAYAGKQFVGIDLHRRRTVIVWTTEAGEVPKTVRIVNEVQRLASVMAKADQCPKVVLEANLRLGQIPEDGKLARTSCPPG